MASVQWLMVLSGLTALLSASHHCKAQAPSPAPAKSLDVLLQDYAYRAFGQPQTGLVYNGHVPSNLSGVQIAAVRLRTGSLRTRGMRGYKEFNVPTGVVLQPYTERMAFVYQNLGNWSSVYYPLPGYTYLAPVLGLLAYDAGNLSATNLPELDLVASGLPILINFTNVSTPAFGLVPKCVWFDLNGSPEFRDLVSSGVCSTYRQGHFAVVVNITGLAPAPSPSEFPTPAPSPSNTHKAKVSKIVAGSVGGVLALVLLVLLLSCLFRCSHRRKMKEMERRAEVGETLRTARVANTEAPVASGTRTQPVLENEYFA